MNQNQSKEVVDFLNLQNPPGRVTREEAAWKLGFTVDEITVLIARNLLKPLGHPAHNGQKYFLTATLDDLRRDEKWYSKASDAIVDYWRYKNSRKGTGAADEKEPQAEAHKGK